MSTRPTPTRRQLALAAPAVLVLLTAACGSTNSASTPAPTTAASSAAPAAAAGETLSAVVGEGDAFTIDLKDSSGAAVTTLKAGTYQIKVKDASKIHNFHLTGPGVEQKTSVPDIVDTTWTVTLTAGSYTYRCDPHKNMTGSFTVT